MLGSELPRDYVGESAPAPKVPALHYAVRCLSRREHGYDELVRKLVARGYPESDAHAAATTCQGNGWQSDARYAVQRVEYRQIRGYGPAFIRHELEERGIAAVLIDALMPPPTDIRWRRLARRALDKRYGEAKAGSAAEAAKRAAYLVRHGFDEDMARDLVGDGLLAAEHG